MPITANHLVQLTLLGSLAGATAAAAKPVPTSATVVQLFEWRWDDVAAECPRLAASGMRFVHVSPPNEHAAAVTPSGAPAGHVWYDRYQPVSYAIGNRSGDEASFRSMLGACRAVGVNILVDAVLNHTAIIPPEGIARFGNLGTQYWRYSTPGLFSYFDYHRCERHPPDSHIYDYNDRYEVQNCNLSGLGDLATESSYVRDTLAAYLRKLVDLGVAGFRLDAAKHIPAADIAAILERMGRPEAYVFQEVIASPTEPIQASEYVRVGQVTEFGFAASVGWRFAAGQLFGIDEELNRLSLASSDAVVFVDNHDTQRGHGAGQAALTYKQGYRYALATAFMLAWPYGTPVVMSSYRFQGDKEGPPLDGSGQVLRVDASCGHNDAAPWICEHRWGHMRTMARWREAVGDAPVDNFQGSWNELAFSRGDRGFFAVNLTRYDVERYYRTGLPEGSYCDVITMGVGASSCPDYARIQVGANRVARVWLRANSAVAFLGGRAGG